MIKISLTAEGSGYFVVYVDGEKFSQHNAEREAVENAVEYKLANPDAVVIYKHEYAVNVEVEDDNAPAPISREG